MSSRGEPTAAQQQGPPPGSPGADDLILGLGELRGKLEGILRGVAQSAPGMDASAAHSHQLVAEIYTFASERIFVAGRLDPARYEDVRQLFEKAREAEDDTHYVYQGVLKRYEKRSKGNLTVAEDAADLDGIAGWRRKYIHNVREFKDHVVNLEDYLSGRSTPPKQEPGPGSGHGSE